MDASEIPDFDPNSILHRYALEHLNQMSDLVSEATVKAIASQWPMWVEFHRAMGVMVERVRTTNRAEMRRRRRPSH